jgi:hypothetical protein
MRCIILASVARLAVQYFPHYLIKGKIFGGGGYLTQNVFSFSTQILSEKFLILRRIQRDIIINVRRYLCEVPVILVRF